MKAVIVGCGRVGAMLADHLDRAGHEVLILDVFQGAFDRLPGTFGGSAVRGDGTDEDVLRRAGAQDADLFLALTEGDNRNIMASQLALEALGARRTIAKVNDPVRAAAYTHLGIATLCRTDLMAAAVLGFLGMAPDIVPAVQAPTRPHEHEEDGAHAATEGDGSGARAGTGGATGRPPAPRPGSGESIRGWEA
jgi:trk system potassium uptake protein